MVSISIHSPRRSPRISDQDSKRQSPRLSARQSTGSSANAAGQRRVADDDARVSPSNGKAKGPARRAYSLGGDHLRKSKPTRDKDNTVSIVPSRRNVPGPRKSAIRAAPPQVFASPTISDPVPIIRTASLSSDGLSAIGGNDLLELMQSIETSRGEVTSEAKIADLSSRRSISEAHRDAFEEQEIDNTIARKKRRVTFNPYQERNDFDWKEPTISIRPSGETELVTIGSTSSGSNESADMSIDSEDSQSQDNEDAEEASMELTAAYESYPNQKADMTSEDSAMDMTTAMGGVIDTTRSMLPSGAEEFDDDSASEDQSMSTDSTPRRDNGDQTVTMQFTSIQGLVDDDSMTRLVAEEEVEDDEVDMQLEGIVAASSTVDEEEEEDDSAMELTETFSPDRTNQTARSNQSIVSMPASTSRVFPSRSPSPKKGHEFCHMPAAESPKQHLSSATQKAIARRQSLAQSPINKGTKGMRSSVDNHLSSSSPAKSRSEDRAGRVSTARPSLLASKIPISNSNINQKKRPSSPSKPPASPSKVWQSFRKSNGSASPVKAPFEDMQSSNRSSFGSPQRIRVELAEISSNALQQEPVAVVKEKPVTTTQFFSSLGIDFPKAEMPRKRHVQIMSPVKDEADDLQKIKAACGQVGFLDSLMEACEELKETVEEGSGMLAKMEDDFVQYPPLYVAEVNALGDGEDRERAIAAFRLQKSAARANALQAYYAWRAEKQFDDPALAKMEEVRDGLQADVQLVRSQKKQVREIAIPALQKRHAALVEEIAREKKRQRKIQEGEKQELSELHRAMEEQGAVLEEQKNTHDEALRYLCDIQRQLKGVTDETKLLEEKVDLTEKLCAAHKSYTKEEASILARDIEQMSVLHLWRIHSVDASRVVMELKEGVELTLILKGRLLEEAKVVIYNGLLWRNSIQEALNARLSPNRQRAGPAAIVRFITTAWTRIRHVMATFEGLRAHYPTEMLIDFANEQQLTIRSSILSLQHRSKLVIELHFPVSRLFDLAVPIFSESDVQARCVYGDIKVAAVNKKIAKSMGERKDEVNFASLIMQAVA